MSNACPMYLIIRDFVTPINLTLDEENYCHVLSDYRRVLDWQLDLLDHRQLHIITVYTLYDSQQLSFFSSSEDYGSNSATNSYGVPCRYSLTDSLTNLPLAHWRL
jgi:hypothetical protein